MDGFFAPWRALRHDPRWASKLGIAALVFWVPYVGPFLVLGWTLEWMSAVARGRESVLPEWTDWGRLLKRGFLGYVVVLPYSLALMVAWYCVAGIATVMAGTGAGGTLAIAVAIGTDQALASGLVMSIAVAVLTAASMVCALFAAGLALAPVTHAATLRYALFDSVREGLEVRQVLDSLGRSPRTALRAWSYGVAVQVFLMLVYVPLVYGLILGPWALAAAGVATGMPEDAMTLVALVGQMLSPIASVLACVVSVATSVATAHWWGTHGRAAYGLGSAAAGRPARRDEPAG